MLTALQPPRKRRPPGRKRACAGRSAKPTQYPCRLSPAGKGYGRRQHHFLAGKMQLPFDSKLLCCLLQTTVIAACALSSICRSFPPFRETLVSRSFQRDPPLPFGPPTEPAVMLPSAHLPRSVASGTNILWVSEITGFSVILICHGKMQIRIRIKKSWE